MGSSATTASSDAAEAIRLVQAQPRLARSLAVSARAAAARAGDGEAASMAERALGLVAKEQSDMAAACAHLRAAVRLAEQAGSPARAGEARMSLSLVLAHQGDADGALREVDLATASLTGDAAAQAQMQRALILQHLDRFEEALGGYRRALVVFRRSDDKLWETRALCNRGVLHTNRGDFTHGHADLLRALELCEEIGYDLGAGMVQHNLGYLCARKGDVLDALRWYDGAARRYREAGVSPPMLDRAELLLSVRLVAEARATAEQAVADLGRGRMALRLAEARLILSQAALLDGDVATARAAAEQARRGFSRQRRPAWAALARYAQLRAEWSAGDRSARTLASARRTARALGEVGWAVAAMDARVLAARMALDLGRVEVASRELASASRARHRGPVELRARAWHAKALLALARGQRRPALAALRCGLEVLDEQRAALGATELRAHVSGHGADLAEAGLRLAVEDGDPAVVLEWAERWRAGALRSRPVRPPEDPVLAGEMAQLRQVVREREEAALGGRETASLLLRQGELEESVRQRARRVAGQGAAGPATAPPAAALAAALGDKALVEMVELDGHLHAVVVTADRVTLRALAPAGEAAAELEAMHFALRRLARGRGTAQSLEVAVGAVGYAAKRLDGLLLDPLAGDVEDRALVVVPTGRLHVTPWSLLPSCLGRGVTVTPCAALWHDAVTQPRPERSRDGVVLVAGPGLPYGAQEVARLARSYRGATRLVGEHAGVAAVLSALDGARLAHVAAHGAFRSDNPLFSCLAMADGPLTVYDLETLGRAPDTLVLSACESGLSGLRPGDELMGLAAALLGLGTRTLIASVVAVPDEQTAGLMLDVHRHLRRGAAPAEALCRAQASTMGSGDVRAIAAAAGFICFGAG
jgi:tetratricopeptide (TPR) repeat protein